MTTESETPTSGGNPGGGKSNGRVQSDYSANAMSGDQWPANTGNLDALPVALRELAELPQWVCFRLEPGGKTHPDGTPKPDKIPYNPHAREWSGKPNPKGRASSTNPKTWGTYLEAAAALKRHGGDGLGFVFHPESSPVLGVDLDGCMEDGGPNDQAGAIVDLLDSYTETSPSGNGLHILLTGKLPEGRRKNTKTGIEVYESGRFFTVTGCHLAGTPDHIEDRTAELAAFHARYMPTSPAVGVAAAPAGSAPLTDGEVLDLAFNAKNGGKVRALYNGDTSGYPSGSEADGALACALAFYTKDPAQIERLMRGSRLNNRDKWKRPDYLSRTVDSALAKCTEQYQPAGVMVPLKTNGKRPPANMDPATGEFLEDGPDQVPGINPEEQLTDLGNAVRFIQQHGADLRWIPEQGAWAVYDGRHWKKDDGMEAERRAKATALAMSYEAATNEAMPRLARERLAKHAIKSQDAKRLRDMLNVARSEAILHLARMDADQWVLNCQNCTVDLKTGAGHPHRRDDYLSKIAATDYDPDATCPTWLRCLETWLPDADVREYFQEAVGYALTGSVQEQCFFFLYGHGRNGKGTAMNTLSHLIGDYAQTARPEILLAKKGDGGIGNEIAELKGARLVVTKEVDRGRPFSEAQLKTLTGGDKRRGRFLFQNSFEYWPTDKIFLEANHKPQVRDLTLAFWRRVKLIPFTVTIPEDQVDPELDKRLRGEWPGILAWAVRGCLRWQERGRLEDPLAVRAAVAAYRDESDILGDYLNERCSLNPRFKTPLADAYKDYVDWCADNRERFAGKKDFSARLEEHDGLHVQRGRGNKVYVIGLAPKGTAITGELTAADEPAAIPQEEEVF